MNDTDVAIAENNPFIEWQPAQKAGWAGASAVGMGEIPCVQPGWG